ncbi:hypothetical protein [Nocardioides humi]|uniref:Uncharacterized protein n=1 Tax=Nocardioides humi TaxID=449461 RepID=A0ABN2B2H2_9ACTN|nr:hypothetical protein [Nocardioides humi]
MDRPLGRLSRLAAAALALPLLVLAPATARADPRAVATDSRPIALPTDAPDSYRLERTAPGSTFHVALWYVGAGDSVGEGVRLTIGTTPTGTGCGSGAVFRPTLGEPAPLLYTTASTWTDEPDHPCGTADELHVTVGVPSDPADRGRDAVLLVHEEPPLSSYSFDLLREPPAPTWTPLDAEPEPDAVTPGTTPADAPVLGPGSHAFAVRPGRTALVAVPLDWDQSLRAQVDGSPEATVTILGPLLGADVASSGPGRAQSYVTSYLHRDSFDPTRSGASLAGVRYVLVDLPAESPATEVTLSLAVDGTAGDGVPDYGSLADSPPAQPAPDDTAEDTQDPSPAAWIGAGVALALVAAALVVRARRARRRRRPTRRGARVRGR